MQYAPTLFQLPKVTPASDFVCDWDNNIQLPLHILHHFATSWLQHKKKPVGSEGLSLHSELEGTKESMNEQTVNIQHPVFFEYRYKNHRFQGNTIKVC